MKEALQLDVHSPALQLRRFTLALLQARPQAPQWLGVVVVLASQPLPGGSWFRSLSQSPKGGWHTRLQTPRAQLAVAFAAPQI